MLALSIARARQLSSIVELLAQPLDADSLRERIVQPLAHLLDADVVASFVWEGAERGYQRGVGCGMAQARLRDYEAELQFEDSIAVALHPLHVPTLVTQVIPQRELVRLSFYDRFLSRVGLRWGLNVFAHDGRHDVGDLRIWRRGDKPNFDGSDVALLRLLYPALVTALSRGVARGRAPAENGPEASTRALFALLSPRETDVARLIGAGATDKEIAAALEISCTTVRTHLARALRKTRCRNRRDLMIASATACSCEAA